MKKETSFKQKAGNGIKRNVSGMLPLSDVEKESIKFAKWIRKKGWVVGDNPDRDYSEEDLMEIYKGRKR